MNSNTPKYVQDLIPDKDTIWKVHEDGMTSLETIVMMKSRKLQGLFNVSTPCGYIVVDGAIASIYASRLVPISIQQWVVYFVSNMFTTDQAMVGTLPDFDGFPFRVGLLKEVVTAWRPWFQSFTSPMFQAVGSTSTI